MAAPPHSPADAAATTLRDWLDRHRRVFVLTGAGVSTGSGIPDYRDAAGAWKRPAPVTFQAFATDASTHARYWARAFVGWPRFSEAAPNAAHRALSAWEARGGPSLLLTQNVDALHQKAGSRNVIDLHGRLDEVVCLGCRARFDRDEVQQRMARQNPHWAGVQARPGPDGDADLESADFSTFRAPACPACEGLLKPDVVFFGENVPRARFEASAAALASSDAVLVVGSSLMVYSGYRFVRLAREAGRPIAILTAGTTRADDLADLKLAADCVDVLPLALG